MSEVKQDLRRFLAISGVSPALALGTGAFAAKGGGASDGIKDGDEDDADEDGD